jgi:hypothetical protein
MKKRELLIRISLIHAVKCAKSSSFEDAISSFNRLNSFKGEVTQFMDDSNYQRIENDISIWQNDYPIVSEAALNELRTNR